MQNFDNEAHKAFCEYAEAKGRVEQTMDFKDAERAGRAWVKFLNAYLPEERQMPTSNVVPFPRRAAR